MFSYNFLWRFWVAIPVTLAELAGTKYTTRHNSADSLPTSNLVCIKEVAIRTTFCIAGMIYYTWNLAIDIQCTR